MQAGAVPAIIALSVGEGVEMASQRRCAAALCNLACAPANIARMVEVRSDYGKQACTRCRPCDGIPMLRHVWAPSTLIEAFASTSFVFEKRHPMYSPTSTTELLQSPAQTGRRDTQHHTPPQDRRHTVCQGGNYRVFAHFRPIGFQNDSLLDVA